MKLSGSKLALLPFCQYFARDDAEHHDLAGRDALMGRAGHTCCERHLLKLPVDVAAICAEHGLTESETETIAAKWPRAKDFLERNARVGWRAEIAYAYNFTTGEGVELPKGEYHRDYRACPEGFIPMTLDVVGWTRIGDPITGEPLEVPFVLDWKWGYGAAVEDPLENGQLQGQALAVAATLDATMVLVVVAHVREEGVDLREALFTASTLAEAHAKHAARIDAIPTAQPTPGAHCANKFCPAINSCPRTQEALVAAAQTKLDGPLAFRFTPKIESNEHASWLIDARAAAGKALDAIDAALETWSDEHDGIPRPNGTVWQANEQPTESPNLDAPGALAVLEAEGVTLRPKASWKDMGPAAKRVRERLRGMGALKISKRRVYEERKAG